MNKYKDTYIYPAIFKYNDDGISVSFPDLPGCLTCGSDEEEAFYMAEDVLGLYMSMLEDDNEELPEPSQLKNIELLENQKCVLIRVWMPTIRGAIMNKAIKKTLTIPQWLDIEAKRRDLNFSQILQKALKKELQIK